MLQENNLSVLNADLEKINDAFDFEAILEKSEYEANIRKREMGMKNALKSTLLELHFASCVLAQYGLLEEMELIDKAARKYNKKIKEIMKIRELIV